MEKILIVDDDAFICQILKKYLQVNKYDANYVLTGKAGLEQFNKVNYDLVLCDFRLPDTSGLELLQKIKSINQETPVIIITAYADVRMAVKLMKMGADDYITKPIQQEELLSLIQKLIGQSKKTPAKKQGSSFYTNGEFVFGTSQKITQAIKLSKKVAPTDMSVIIGGETGVGKEYIARFIHQHSSRKDKPFVAMDCGAIPKDLANSELFGHVKGSFTGAVKDKDGVFQRADGGTLFLDEIGNLNYDVQLKLLRAIQERVVTRLGDDKERKINIRIIAATNDDIRNEVNESAFREDLYHRLNEFTIDLPPLRQRPEDILIFVKHFIAMANEELDLEVTGLSAAAEATVLNYPWYGNLRELKNVIKRAVLMTEGQLIDNKCFPVEILYPQTINVDEIDQPSDPMQSATLKDASSEVEKQLMIKTLQEAGYNKSKAARMLNIDRKTLYNKISKYNIKL